MKMTVKEFIEADFDMDIYDDVCEDLALAKCGAYELTEAALDKFAFVLGLTVEVDEDDGVAVLLIDEYDDWEARLAMAIKLFDALAGYCPAVDYEKWFIEK